MRILTNARRAGMAGAVAALVLTVAVVTRGPRMPEAIPDRPTGELEAGADGAHEGIKVHGHWAIEVRNPDGSVSESREFENALTVQGATGLALFLGRRLSGAGRWSVQLFQSAPPAGDQSSSACIDPQGARNRCIIAEPDEPTSQSNVFPNLTLEAGAGEFLLSGSAVAAVDGVVGHVETLFIMGPFTATDITPIAVFAGQSIVVTVTISFS